MTHFDTQWMKKWKEANKTMKYKQVQLWTRKKYEG